MIKNKKQIMDNLEAVLIMEKLGIHIEKVKELKDEYGIPSKQAYFFTVPESSTIDMFDSETKTAEGLIKLAKESIYEIIIESYISVFGEDDEFIDDFKKDITDIVKFYVKVRHGEVWTKDMGDIAVKKIIAELEQAIKENDYKEV